MQRKDERGYQLDFHALRTTMATRLLRAGVTASHAKLITRHTSTSVLERRYNALTMTDARAAMQQVPWIGTEPAASAALEHLGLPGRQRRRRRNSSTVR